MKLALYNGKKYAIHSTFPGGKQTCILFESKPKWVKDSEIELVMPELGDKILTMISDKNNKPKITVGDMGRLDGFPVEYITVGDIKYDSDSDSYEPWTVEVTVKIVSEGLIVSIEDMKKKNHRIKTLEQRLKVLYLPPDDDRDSERNSVERKEIMKELDLLVSESK